MNVSADCVHGHSFLSVYLLLACVCARLHCAFVEVRVSLCWTWRVIAAFVDCWRQVVSHLVTAGKREGWGGFGDRGVLSGGGRDGCTPPSITHGWNIVEGMSLIFILRELLTQKNNFYRSNNILLYWDHFNLLLVMVMISWYGNLFTAKQNLQNQLAHRRRPRWKFCSQLWPPHFWRNSFLFSFGRKKSSPGVKSRFKICPLFQVELMRVICTKP